MRYLSLATFSLLSVLAIGCHFFEDSDNIDDCPLNSGYPCPCTYDDSDVYQTGECRDGSACLAYVDDQSHGICAETCSGVSDATSCFDTKAYGTEGLCWTGDSNVYPQNYCAVYCEGTEDDNCSPGMVCTPVTGETGYYICLPKTES